MSDDIQVILEEEIIEVSIEETTIVVDISGGPGPQGPPGLTGPQGDPGLTGGSAYSHVESAPSSDWVINHNLNRYPHVTVIVGGEDVDAEVTYNSLNQVTVSFGSPQSGRAELS